MGQPKRLALATVSAIKQALKAGGGTEAVARQFDCSPETVRRIKFGDSHREVEPQLPEFARLTIGWRGCMRDSPKLAQMIFPALRAGGEK